MDSDGLSQLSSLIYNDFKNVNNAVSEAYNKANNAYNKANLAYDSVGAAYDKANSAYDSVSAAYDQANIAYDKANSAYDLASSSGDDFIYYNLPTVRADSVGFDSGDSRVAFWYIYKYNVPSSYLAYNPHSVSFDYESDYHGRNNTKIKATSGFYIGPFIYTNGFNTNEAFVFSTVIGYNWHPVWNSGKMTVNNVVFRFTK